MANKDQIVFDLAADELDAFVDLLFSRRAVCPFNQHTIVKVIKEQRLLPDDRLVLTIDCDDYIIVERWLLMITLIRPFKYSIKEKNAKSQHSQHQGQHSTLSKFTTAIREIISRG
jgi:hypothetical protein